MDEDQIEGCVSGYLKQKGFAQNDDKLQLSNTDSSLQPNTLNRAQLERGSARYHDGYGRLRSWAYRSLESYKHELLRVLYPVFIHCFMDLVAKGHLQEAWNFFNTFREDHEMLHSRDLQKLELVLSPTHLEEMEFAHSLRQSKFNIKICRYSYELLLQHLHSMQSTTIIGIINEHINFQVTAGQPSSISDDPEAVTLSGSIQDAVNQINQKEILWGMFEDSVEDHIDKAGALLSGTEKGEGEGKEGDNDESKKRSIDVGKQGNSVKKVKKDKVSSATGKNAKPEASTISAAPRIKPELPLPTVSTDVELSILEDLRNRVQLNSVALPSVNFYTFVNTHNGLSCSSISHDGSLLVGGFSDSSLKVLSLHPPPLSTLPKEHPFSLYSFILGLFLTRVCRSGIWQNLSNNPLLIFRREGMTCHKMNKLLGKIVGEDSTHCFKVTQVQSMQPLLVLPGIFFFPLQRTKQFDYGVQSLMPILFVTRVTITLSGMFSPAGHYFASCSHDRTARIWSMDRIKPLRIMAGHLSDVDCVQWHPNCNYIATGSSDKTVRLWDVQSGECVRVFIGHRSMILSLAMSPDGRYMASGDEDGTIMMWDLSSGCCVTPLVSHTSCVWSLAFSCEGSLLASGSADCTVKFWDVTTGIKVPRNEEKSGNANRLRSLKSLPTKSASVYSLQFSRRNLLFAAGALAKSGC
ncbi:transcription initiation factor TFIID subunit 5-like isoform X2 [Vigna unguiculata]|uniref:transcription initiation factor TFIID subunit 5-like isoform X2 n=1 Tax=Vigna unguiculata TaxID=3917 RepID=UPI001016E476|nr:transcription initiation factor TFIID subunit 5-like isoform X2 [Vigna unguiculata]